MEDKIKQQGVISQIEFPLGQDEIAISKAIADLLTEGWRFVFLTKTHITLNRSWEYDSKEEGGEEVSPIVIGHFESDKSIQEGYLKLMFANSKKAGELEECRKYNSFQAAASKSGL